MQGRYKAIIVDRESYLLELSRYIHLNPVRAGIVERPEKYKWSSYRYYAGSSDVFPRWLDIEWINERFGSTMSRALKKYCEFVEDGLSRKLPNPFESVVGGIVLGNRGFFEKIKQRIKGTLLVDQEVPASKHLVTHLSLEDLTEVISSYFNITVQEIRERQYRSLPRRVAIYLARKYTGISLKELGHYFGIGYTAISETTRAVKMHRRAQKSIEEIRELILQQYEI
ncbi:MAG: helix-turn-helix domain-containing protein [Candidatus Cloacimonadia bacterium]